MFSPMKSKRQTPKLDPAKLATETAKQTEITFNKDSLQDLCNRTLKAIADQLGYLWGRWQDEKEYEDWGDYEKAMKRMMSAHPAFSFLKSTKSPFGFKAQLVGTPHVTIQFSATSNSVAWKVVH